MNIFAKPGTKIIFTPSAKDGLTGKTMTRTCDRCPCYALETTPTKCRFYDDCAEATDSCKQASGRRPHDKPEGCFKEKEKDNAVI
jgi:hypothetical protein